MDNIYVKNNGQNLLRLYDTICRNLADNTEIKIQQININRKEIYKVLILKLQFFLYQKLSLL